MKLPLAPKLVALFIILALMFSLVTAIAGSGGGRGGGGGGGGGGGRGRGGGSGGRNKGGQRESPGGRTCYGCAILPGGGAAARHGSASSPSQPLLCSRVCMAFLLVLLHI